MAELQLVRERTLRKAVFSPLVLTDTYLYSEELPADEVLKLRVLLRLAGGPRQATSPPSQVEQQYAAASSLTSSPASISHGQPASQLRVAQETP